MKIVPILNMANSPTGLPLVAEFFVPADFIQQLLIVSGTAYTTNKDGGPIQLEVLVEPTIVATPTAYSNEGLSHKALPTAMLVLALTPNATYTLTIRVKDGTQTSTDYNDYFSACVVLGT